MNVIKMKDISGNHVIIERSEMFASFFLDGCDIPPKYYWVPYTELTENFIKETMLLQDKAKNAYSKAMNEKMP
jgi:hypothetical protein